MDIETFCLRARLEIETVRSWIEAGFVRAELSEADLARAALIRDLIEDLGVNLEGVEVVLDLLDQLHEARAALRRVLAALADADPAVRARVAAALRDRP
ncbi:chaperone modulator CbpM [Elioraea thermophila]|uniref:chaperone modulator CbpM n=1 Tax=Elioraea thermophila TaxID=2185104 RepID=UPI000DF1E45B|nr:chaperone modulator CbpM [Elioraea thermophila]